MGGNPRGGTNPYNVNQGAPQGGGNGGGGMRDTAPVQSQGSPNAAVMGMLGGKPAGGKPMQSNMPAPGMGSTPQGGGGLFAAPNSYGGSISATNPYPGMEAPASRSTLANAMATPAAAAPAAVPREHEPRATTPAAAPRTTAAPRATENAPRTTAVTPTPTPTRAPTTTTLVNAAGQPRANTAPLVGATSTNANPTKGTAVMNLPGNVKRTYYTDLSKVPATGGFIKGSGAGLNWYVPPPKPVEPTTTTTTTTTPNTGTGLVNTSGGGGGGSGRAVGGVGGTIGTAQNTAPIGGVQGVNGSTGVSPTVELAVNKVIPHITTAQWDAIKGKSWDQLSQGTPQERAIAAEMTRITKDNAKNWALDNNRENNG